MTNANYDGNQFAYPSQRRYCASPPRREAPRLPMGLALPCIAILSISLWLALFRLVALLI